MCAVGDRNIIVAMKMHQIVSLQAAVVYSVIFMFSIIQAVPWRFSHFNWVFEFEILDK